MKLPTSLVWFYRALYVPSLLTYIAVRYLIKASEMREARRKLERYL